MLLLRRERGALNDAEGDIGCFTKRYIKLFVLGDR